MEMRLSPLDDAPLHGHGLRGIQAHSRFATQHHSIAAVEDGIRDVAALLGGWALPIRHHSASNSTPKGVQHDLDWHLDVRKPWQTAANYADMWSLGWKA